jgi:hypothetical protein
VNSALRATDDWPAEYVCRMFLPLKGQDRQDVQAIFL